MFIHEWASSLQFLQYLFCKLFQLEQNTSIYRNCNIILTKLFSTSTAWVPFYIMVSHVLIWKPVVVIDSWNNLQVWCTSITETLLFQMLHSPLLGYLNNHPGKISAMFPFCGGCLNSSQIFFVAFFALTRRYSPQNAIIFYTCICQSEVS